MLDMAAFCTRHNGGLWSSPTVLWLDVQTSRAGIDLHGSCEQQLCVPSVTIRGNSYRMREHTDLWQTIQPGEEPSPSASKHRKKKEARTR